MIYGTVGKKSTHSDAIVYFFSGSDIKGKIKGCDFFVLDFELCNGYDAEYVDCWEAVI